MTSRSQEDAPSGSRNQQAGGLNVNPTEQLNVAATPTESIVQRELAGFVLPEGAQARVVTVVDQLIV